MTGLDLTVAVDLSRSFEPCLNDQNRPFRRCRFIVHIADLSAWGAIGRAMGHKLAGPPINWGPTGNNGCCLLKLLFGPCFIEGAIPKIQKKKKLPHAGYPSFTGHA